MIPVAIQDGRIEMIVSVVLYLISALGVYASSALSHAYSDPRRRDYYRQLDQAFIYIMIVASYTPFLVAHIQGLGWWLMVIAMWLMALWGFSSKLFFRHRVNSVAIWIYLALGWIPGMASMPFAGLLPFDIFLWIMGGGFFYTVGTIFLYNDRRNIYFHSIWHLMVIAGSAVHYTAILIRVLQPHS